MSVPAETPAGATAIRPFHVDIADEALEDLRRRITAVRFPSKELVADRSQGVQLATLQALARYWTTEHDWRRCEARLNALPQFKSEIDGVDIHFIQVRSRHENALPLLITHGWPGSVIELLEVVGPLTDPTAHGGRAEDAFDLVLPSLPGYCFSDEPTSVGWDPGRVAEAWAKLMNRLGYDRYVAQGGDQGAAVTDSMALQAPNGLLGIHLNFLRRPPLDVAAAVFAGAAAPVLPESERAAFNALRAQFMKGESSSRASRRRRSATPSRIRPSVWRPGCSTTTRTATRRSLARSWTGAALRGPHSGQDPRQHHAVLADRHRDLGRADLLGGRTKHRGSLRGREDATRGLDPGRVHGVPRRDLQGPTQLGREGLPQPHLLGRGRQGRPRRRLGGARAVLGRAPGCIQLIALRQPRQQQRQPYGGCGRLRTTSSATS